MTISNTANIFGVGAMIKHIVRCSDTSHRARYNPNMGKSSTVDQPKYTGGVWERTLLLLL